MKALLLNYWDRLRSSFWFVPAAMACLAAALALSAVAIDEAAGDDWLQRLGWGYSGGAEGASLLLGTVAGSMIAIAGTVFSMTLVAMSLASSQLGPRLLRNFMRDTANQVVLGTFVATFVYSLLVLRTIRRADEVAFVPHLSVSIGVLLAMVSIGVLIYFIHHVSVSIQADEVIAHVGRELEDGIDRLFPGHLGQPGGETSDPPNPAGLPAVFAREARPVGAAEDGYLQLIDGDALMALASRADLLLQLERRPGHYLVKGQTMVMVWPGDRVTDALVDQLNDAFVFGNQRTATQDVEFSLHQLVEIAVRALSPGINDPFTAIACVDRLGSALCRLARRDALAAQTARRRLRPGEPTHAAAGPTLASRAGPSALAYPPMAGSAGGRRGCGRPGAAGFHPRAPVRLAVSRQRRVAGQRKREPSCRHAACRPKHRRVARGSRRQIPPAAPEWHRRRAVRRHGRLRRGGAAGAVKLTRDPGAAWPTVCVRWRTDKRPFAAPTRTMSIPSSAIYDYIVRELAPTEHEPDEAPITIVCEPLSGAEGSGPRGKISMRLKAGTTPEEARDIASSLQAKAKGLCQLEASGDGAA